MIKNNKLPCDKCICYILCKLRHKDSDTVDLILDCQILYDVWLKSPPSNDYEILKSIAELFKMKLNARLKEEF